MIKTIQSILLQKNIYFIYYIYRPFSLLPGNKKQPVVVGLFNILYQTIGNYLFSHRFHGCPHGQW